MSRLDFFRKIIRYLLLMLLGIITIFLANRVVSGNDCSACPGNGICKGESDCSKFFVSKDGRREE
jgi:hypothetical protein